MQGQDVEKNKDTYDSKHLDIGDSLLGSVIVSIYNLPIVLKEENMVDSLSNHTRRLNYRVGYYDSIKKQYSIYVAEDNGMSYYTHFIFYVDAKTLKILNPDGRP
jgi:hypothetical protein